MADVAYVSRVKVEPVEGKIRRAHLPAEEEPVLFGAHSEVAELYGISPAHEEQHSSTFDYLVAAAGGDCSAPSRARWQRIKLTSTKTASTPTRSAR